MRGVGWPAIQGIDTDRYNSIAKCCCAAMDGWGSGLIGAKVSGFDGTIAGTCNKVS